MPFATCPKYRFADGSMFGGRVPTFCTLTLRATEYVLVPGNTPTLPKFRVGRGVTLMEGPPPTHERFTTPCGLRVMPVSNSSVVLRGPRPAGLHATTSRDVPPPATVNVVGVSPIVGRYAKSAK